MTHVEWWSGNRTIDGTRVTDCYRLCDVCVRIFENGLCQASLRGREARAVYEWTSLNQAVTALCVQCCAWWRKQALGDPTLAPSSIRQLDRVR